MNQDREHVPESFDQQLVEKPPLGLVPAHIHREQRMLDIMLAMHRFSRVNKPIPILWVEELQDLLLKFKGHYSG